MRNNLVDNEKEQLKKKMTKKKEMLDTLIENFGKEEKEQLHNCEKKGKGVMYENLNDEKKSFSRKRVTKRKKRKT